MSGSSEMYANAIPPHIIHSLVKFQNVASYSPSLHELIVLSWETIDISLNALHFSLTSFHLGIYNLLSRMVHYNKKASLKIFQIFLFSES